MQIVWFKKKRCVMTDNVRCFPFGRRQQEQQFGQGTAAAISGKTHFCQETETSCAANRS